MRRTMLTAFAIASVAGAIPAAQEHATIVGCVARMDQHFLLRTTSTPGAPRTSGSMSAKGSTPIGSGGDAMAPRHESVGSNSAKASTPLGAAASSNGRRTSGVVTPKGSAPIATAEVAYDLDADPDQLAAHLDQLVEIKGTVLAAARRVKVDQFRVLYSTCNP